MPESEQERMDRLEESVYKLNHFTETFPALMEAKLDGMTNTFKVMAKSNADKIDVNRRLLYGIISTIVGGALAVLWLAAQ